MSETWDIQVLTRLTDEVRICLAAGLKLNNSQVEIVDAVLTKLVDDEKGGKIPNLVLVAQTRFDLFIRDIATAACHKQDQLPRNVESMMTHCFAVQKSWRKHFRPSYFVAVVDEERQRNMEEVYLRNVTLNPKDGRWVVQDAAPETLSHTEGSLGFTPGDWWLNLACCYRDGMVGSMVDDITKGPYGVTAIPLLAGEEIECSVPDCFIYQRIGPIQDMYISIMGKLGRTQVRVLRGHKLKSPHAPKGGIRYDGLYTPVEYSHSLDEVTNLYSVKLMFKRSFGAPPVERLTNIPTPSQFDVWKLYVITAVNEKEVTRPKRLLMEPQGMEARVSSLLRSRSFLDALRTTESPSAASASSSAREKKPNYFASEDPDASSSSLTIKPSSPPPSKASVAKGKKKMIAQGTEERGMGTSALLDMLNEGPPGEASSTPSKSPPLKTKKKMIPQDTEERGMRTSDFMDMLNEAPPDETSSTPPKPSALKPPKKLVPQGHEERRKSAHFKDMLNEAPPDEAVSIPSPARKSPVPARRVPAPAKAPPIPVKKVMEDDGDNKPPVVVKKRAKARDLYDIDAMMDEIENDEQFADEEPPKRGPRG